MTRRLAGNTRICSAQGCNERTRRPEHPLCYSHYGQAQIGNIDECPNCGQVYKPSEHSTCRRCYSQMRQPRSQESRRDGRAQPRDDSRGWDRQPQFEGATKPTVEAVDLVRRNMSEHETACVNHETNTIQYLVMPMLKGLGWDESHPAQVVREYKPANQRHRQAIAVDIALMGNRVPRAIIEAKRLDRDYDRGYLSQLSKYTSYLDNGVTAVLTNGRFWIVCVVANGKPEHRSTIDVNAGDPADVASKLNSALGRPDTVHDVGGNATDTPRQALPHPQTIAINLREYRKRESKRRGVPAYTIFRDETIDLVAAQRPPDLRQLGGIRGIGQLTLEQHGATIISIVRGDRK